MTKTAFHLADILIGMAEMGDSESGVFDSSFRMESYSYRMKSWNCLKRFRIKSHPLTLIIVNKPVVIKSINIEKSPKRAASLYQYSLIHGFHSINSLYCLFNCFIDLTSS